MKPHQKNVINLLRLDKIDYLQEKKNYYSEFYLKKLLFVFACYFKPYDYDINISPLLINYRDHENSSYSNIFIFKVTASKEEV